MIYFKYMNITLKNSKNRLTGYISPCVIVRIMYNASVYPKSGNMHAFLVSLTTILTTSTKLREQLIIITIDYVEIVISKNFSETIFLSCMHSSFMLHGYQVYTIWKLYFHTKIDISPDTTMQQYNASYRQIVVDTGNWHYYTIQLLKFMLA